MALGWLNPLPPQQGIPGWQRITFMKHFNEDLNDPMDDNLWAYEGVVLPGGRIILGRWWFASEPIASTVSTPCIEGFRVLTRCRRTTTALLSCGRSTSQRWWTTARTLSNHLAQTEGSLVYLREPFLNILPGDLAFWTPSLTRISLPVSFGHLSFPTILPRR
jgi:hypothetical protein